MPNNELEDLKEAVLSEEDSSDDGSDDTDPALEESEEKEEESVEDLKARLVKAEADRDNYKQGLLSRKAKERSLEAKETSDVSPETPDVSEEKILSVLNKQNEREVLQEALNSDSPLYLPEFEDDNNYKEIILNLPRVFDRSSKKEIHKAFRKAIAAWKVDNGIEIKPDTKSAKARLQESSGAPQDGGKVEVKKEIKKLNIPRAVPPSEWYK